LDIYIERGSKRAFAGALDWPGWCRSGKDEEAALGTLFAYSRRYSAAVRGVNPSFSVPGERSLRIVERLKGDATTDFGAPSIAPEADRRPVSATELGRLSLILEGVWKALDRAERAATGLELIKGPRGGGRNLDEIVGHVVGAEAAYVRRIAGAAPQYSDPLAAKRAVRDSAQEALTRAVEEGLPAAGPRGGKIWLPRYFVRRTAWHALDHAWEIEDRTPHG
jgi:hypothetical protein